jgi:hypothetical protein
MWSASARQGVHRSVEANGPRGRFGTRESPPSGRESAPRRALQHSSSGCLECSWQANAAVRSRWGEGARFSSAATV